MFQRDRLTWVAYVMLAWFAYLQASPGVVVPHLRDELDLSYSVGGLHLAAFAAGSMVAGLASSRFEPRSAVARAVVGRGPVRSRRGRVDRRPGRARRPSARS